MHKILFVFFSSLNPMPLRFIEMLNACNRSYVYRKYFAEFELCIVNEFNWMLDGEIFTFLTLLFCMNFFFTSKSLSQFFFQVLINWEITLHTILYSIQLRYSFSFLFFIELHWIKKKTNTHNSNTIYWSIKTHRIERDCIKCFNLIECVIRKWWTTKISIQRHSLGLKIEKKLPTVYFFYIFTQRRIYAWKITGNYSQNEDILSPVQCDKKQNRNEAIWLATTCAWIILCFCFFHLSTSFGEQFLDSTKFIQFDMWTNTVNIWKWVRFSLVWVL